MPTYDYLCQACGNRFEQFQSITSEPVRVCPVCHKEQVIRIVSGGSGLIFKGTGFYITDYKNSKTSAASASTGSTTSASTSAADSKSAGASGSSAPESKTGKSETTKSDA